MYIGFRDPFKLTEENDTVSDTICVPIRVNFQYVEFICSYFPFIHTGDAWITDIGSYLKNGDKPPQIQGNHARNL